MVNLKIESAGETEFLFQFKVRQGVETLDKLPKVVFIEIVNKMGDILTSTIVNVPIDLYILKLKKRDKPINILLIGPGRAGVSSFVNTVATVFNENEDFKKMAQKIISINRRESFDETENFSFFKFGNLQIFDSKGKFKDDVDYFENVLKNLNPENLDLKSESIEKCIDVVIFFVTPMIPFHNYVSFIRQAHGVCPRFNVKTMFLVTHIDEYHNEIEDDPYSEKNRILLEDLKEQISINYSVDKIEFKPLFNYVNYDFRTWELDKALFIPISHCFMLTLVK